MPLQPRQSQALQLLLFKTRTRTPEAGGMVEECVIHSVGASGAYFTRPDYDGTPANPAGVYVFGPAPYTWPAAGVSGSTYDGGTGASAHTHTIPVPSNGPGLGDRCIVVWVGPSASNPWVVGWWPA